ncbi:HEXXH motif-containing protein [Lentzea californiensis]|nr:HEXXH motif-containing protein [Lentzea californiensis]
MIGSAVPTVASTHAVHAVIAPAGVLVDERRTLYRLAGEIFTPDARLSDKVLDHPVVRYELGRALAGHDDDLTTDTLLHAARLDVRDAAGVAVVSDPAASGKLATALRIIAPAGSRPQVLTEADGDRFAAALALVDEAVRLFRRLAPEMSDDLLAHLTLFAVLKAETSGGVVSASTRYLPGLVLIDEPASAIEIAEALVHECSHLKFFDFAVTRQFLDGERAERAEHFVNSWSKVMWPLEQTFAAWHAYTALAQFQRACETQELSPVSLLPKAHDRAMEIGRWLLDHESDLRSDARWLLRALLGIPADHDESRAEGGGAAAHDGAEPPRHLALVPGVRYARAASGRVVVTKAARPLDIFWLDADSGWVMTQFRVEGATIDRASLLAAAIEDWRVTEGVAIRRLFAALESLLQTLLLEPRDEPSHCEQEQEQGSIT